MQNNLSDMLLSADRFTAIFEIADEIEREKAKNALRETAKELHKTREFDRLYKLYAADYKRMQLEESQNSVDQVKAMLQLDDSAKVRRTRDNFLKILELDKHFEKYFLFNEFTLNRECRDGEKIRLFSDADEADIRHYIEKTYNISDNQKTEDAITLIFEKNKYHPIHEKIESTTWDGVPRIRFMLQKWLSCEDTPYIREVGRLIFHSGILRLYEPGCKADLMPVLIGKQGANKSTFVRKLAISDDWFREIGEFEGSRGMEALEGGFICEVSELLALKRSKESAAVKSFLTRQYDNYRKPYAKYPVNNPRKCIFIGTTNTQQFINDPTGGRRYLPVEVGEGHIWENMAAFEQDVLQCWAEAYADYQAGNATAVESRDLLPDIRAHQENAQEDDWRIGAIEEYLEDKSIVCVKQIWEEALKMNFPPTKRDSMEVSLLMQNMSEWEKTGRNARLPKYGLAKVWERKAKFALTNWEEIE